MKTFLVFFKNLKFNNKLFLSYLLVIVIPIITLGFYSYFQAKKLLLDEEKLGLSESIRQISENLNYKFSGYRNVIGFLVFNEPLIQIVSNQDKTYFDKYVDLTETLDPLINTVLNTNNDIDKVLIYTNNKNLTERADSIISLDRLAGKPWYKQVTTDRKLQWLVEGKKVYGFIKFMKPYKDAPLSLLCVEMKYDNVFNVTVNKTNKYGILITDNKNNIIYSKDTTGAISSTGIKVLLNEHESREEEIEGINYIVIKDSIKETGWNLYYYSPTDQVIIDANGIVKATAVIVLVCFGILVLITFIFSKSFVRRINKLNEKMKIVEDGNLKIDVSSSSKDEIGELTNRFGKMLSKINILINEVYHGKIVQKDAEMKALQAQINPHFLYNTLSLINWKAITIDAMEISQVTTNLSKFYRTILNKGNNLISVKDEVSNIKCYVEIQLALHRNSFDVEYFFEDDIYKYQMINIILQPVVENAIEHGIDHKREGRGKLTISGYILGNDLIFKVLDNGQGMDEEKTSAVLLTDKGGYGLKNVQERIKIFFGENYGISIKSTLGEGTCVIINIPQYIPQ